MSVPAETKHRKERRKSVTRKRYSKSSAESSKQEATNTAMQVRTSSPMALAFKIPMVCHESHQARPHSNADVRCFPYECVAR